MAGALTASRTASSALPLTSTAAPPDTPSFASAEKASIDAGFTSNTRTVSDGGSFLRRFFAIWRPCIPC